MKSGTGFIVGQFQTPRLTDSHRELFESVIADHDEVMCIITLSPIKGTTKHFLDYHQRVKMIQEIYPEIKCLYIDDQKKDSVWSKRLDQMVQSMLKPFGRATLYGSSDAFVEKYKGRFTAEVLEADSFASMESFIDAESRSNKANYFVRLGMLIATTFKYPTSYQTVDIAIMDKDNTKIWLGRKENEDKFRFIGGFSDPDSESLEDDATREAFEETGIVVDRPKYIFSMKIDDWRYRNEIDCIKTAFFIAQRTGGNPCADDDIAEIKCFDVSDFVWPEGESPIDTTILRNGNLLVKGHHGLMLRLVEELKSM